MDKTQINKNILQFSLNNTQFTLYAQEMSFVYNKSIKDKIFRLNKIGVYSDKNPDIESKLLVNILCSIFENSYLVITGNYNEYQQYNFNNVDRSVVCIGHVTENVVAFRRNTNNGKRFIRRGINTQNQAGNAIQMITFFGQKIEYLRGQMPVCYSQTTEIFRGLCGAINIFQDQTPALRYLKELNDYGQTNKKNIVLLNLIDTKGKEQNLLRQYQDNFLEFLQQNKPSIQYILKKQLLQGKVSTLDVQNHLTCGCIIQCSNSNIQYIHLDYHSINKNLKKVIRTIHDYSKQQWDNIIYRVNCVDSLDRTNQTIKQLCIYQNSIENETDIQKQFKAIGNKLSLQYTGTQTMKQYQGLKGKIFDLNIFCQRFIKNQYTDSITDQAYEILNLSSQQHNNMKIIHRWSQLITQILIRAILIILLILMNINNKYLAIVLYLIVYLIMCKYFMLKPIIQVQKVE